MKDKNQKLLSYIILVLPGVILYASIIVFPIFYCIGLSFTEWVGFGKPLNMVGFDNYIEIFKDHIFLHGLRNNLLIVAISVFGQIPLGFVLAYIIYRKMVMNCMISM